MGLRTRLAKAIGGEELRDIYPISWNQYLLEYFGQGGFMSYGGSLYPLTGSSSLNAKSEPPQASFDGFIRTAYKSNGVIFACMLARLLLFSEARFQFRQVRNGRPGDLFGTQDLQILEEPWPNGTTGDLLTRAIQDADLSGNFYAARDGNYLRRMRPDWVTIVLGSDYEDEDPRSDLNQEVVGYIYKPGGAMSNTPAMSLLPEQVCHFAPIPDPAARFRGMSWLTPIIRELMADSAATEHKLKFFEQGATPNMVVSSQAPFNKDSFKEYVDVMRDMSEGMQNAYKTLYLGAGATVDVIGSNFQQMDFKVTQGAGETRIAAAAGVPPIIVGLSEGLASATYSNYGQARRRFADGTMRPLWRNMAASMARIVNVPSGAELWYDDRDVSFLQEDQKDAADIQAVEANTIHSLISAGFEPTSVIDAVTANDFERLTHTGLYSVQLQPAGSITEGKGSVVQGVPVPEPRNGGPSLGRDENGKLLPAVPPNGNPVATP